MRTALNDIVVSACNIAHPESGDLVLDIGCNDGTLLRSYNIPGLRRIGFEPAKNLVRQASEGNDYVFNDFFSFKLFHNKFGNSRAKIITSIAMFYDLDDPHGFVADVAKCLDTRGVWIVQQNYLPSMLEKNGFDNIGHEHLTYYSLHTMKSLLENHNLQIFHVETNEVNGGSFRTYASRPARFPVRDSVHKMEDYEAKLFTKSPSIYGTFAHNVRNIRSQLKNFIADQVKNGKSVYAYGASTRGNTILQYCGLNRKLIPKATDANPEKWGLKTPGTAIPIISKKEARKDDPDFFLVLPHHFLSEIEKEEGHYLRSGGRFIVPLPKFRVLSSLK